MDGPGAIAEQPARRQTRLTSVWPSATVVHVGHLDVAGISYSLADGRPLLADVTFRVGQGSVTALIGPNGTGKTTLLRIITGELAAEDGAISRTGALGVMPQFIGSVRDDSTVRDLLLTVSPDADAGGRRPDRRGRARDDDRRERRGRDALRAGTRRLGRRTRLRPGERLRRGLRRRAGRSRTTGPSSERSPACPAASRSGWCWNCCWPGRTTCCCWTSRTTISTCPERSGSRASWPRPSKAVLLISHDRELLAQVRDPDRHPRTGRGRRGVLGARRFVRRLRPGQDRPQLPARGAAPPLGRGARQAQGTGAHVQDQGCLHGQPGVALPGRQDPAVQVRGGRAAGGTAAVPAGHDAAQGRPHGQAGGGLQPARAHRPDGAVRPGDLLRRAARCAGCERIGKVAFPAAAGGGRIRPRHRAPAGHRLARRTRPSYRHGRSRCQGAARLLPPDPLPSRS